MSMYDIGKARRARFSEADWLTDRKWTVTIEGLGGIGSWVALLVSRSVYPLKLLLYDMDIVSEVNIGGQLYGPDDVGLKKTDVSQTNIGKFSGVYDIITFEEFKETSVISSVCISAFDNMKARRAMFNVWKNAHFPGGTIFIDGRLLAEYYQIYFVTPDRIEEYEKTLFDDSEVEQENCAFKQTTHFAAMIASKMVQGLTNWIVNNKGGNRELPFKYTEVGPLFHVEISEKEEVK